MPVLRNSWQNLYLDGLDTKVKKEDVHFSGITASKFYIKRDNVTNFLLNFEKNWRQNDQV